MASFECRVADCDSFSLLKFDNFHVELRRGEGATFSFWWMAPDGPNTVIGLGCNNQKVKRTEGSQGGEGGGGREGGGLESKGLEWK